MKRRIPILLLLLGTTACFAIWSADTDRERYDAGDEGTASFHNGARVDAFLEGCSAFSFEKLEGRIWNPRGTPVVCVWEGLAQPVAAGTSVSFPFIAPDESGTWRLRFTVGLGCDPRSPLREETCEGIHIVHTRPFEVHELCDPSECGPPLGMPNWLCPDGVNFGGPTGRCLFHPEFDSCGWEVASCPEEDGAQ